jgi:hypothetical protein
MEEEEKKEEKEENRKTGSVSNTTKIQKSDVKYTPLDP